MTYGAIAGSWWEVYHRCSITSIFSSKSIPQCKIWIHGDSTRQNVACFHKMWRVMEQTTNKMRSSILEDGDSRNAMRDWLHAEIRNDMKIVIHCILLARLAPHEKMILLSNDYDVHTILREGVRKMEESNLRILDVQKFKNAV